MSCCWFQVVIPGSLKRIQSINKHNRAERTNSDISCKKRCSLTHLWLLFDGISRYFHDAEQYPNPSVAPVTGPTYYLYGKTNSTYKMCLFNNNGGVGNRSSFCCLLLKFLHNDSNVSVKNSCCAQSFHLSLSGPDLHWKACEERHTEHNGTSTCSILFIFTKHPDL